jgi:uncharacterized membrane protein YedE/YeeE
MDMIAPFAKTGAISASTNLWLAIPIGIVLVMFSAIATGMLGLWGLSLLGVLDISRIYMLPTFLLPMAIGGLIFGVGMVIGGYCPGTAAASIATGKIDALVFIVGFLLGSLLFGDMFPIWGDFYNSNYLGAYRLDEWLGIGLGPMVLIIVVVAVGGTLMMRYVQNQFWPTGEDEPKQDSVIRLQAALIAVAVVIGFVFAFMPTVAFIDTTVEAQYYIIPRTGGIAAP